MAAATPRAAETSSRRCRSPRGAGASTRGSACRDRGRCSTCCRGALPPPLRHAFWPRTGRRRFGVPLGRLRRHDVLSGGSSHDVRWGSVGGVKGGVVDIPYREEKMRDRPTIYLGCCCLSWDAASSASRRLPRDGRSLRYCRYRQQHRRLLWQSSGSWIG